MNKAKLVMFFYALAAILSMLGIGVFASFVFLAGTNKYDTIGIIGIIGCIIAMCAIFMMGFIQKSKFRKAGLL